MTQFAHRGLALTNIAFCLLSCLSEPKAENSKSDAGATQTEAAQTPGDAGAVDARDGGLPQLSDTGVALCQRACELEDLLRGPCNPGDLMLGGKLKPHAQSDASVAVDSGTALDSGAAVDPGATGDSGVVVTYGPGLLCYDECATVIAAHPQCEASYGFHLDCFFEGTLNCQQGAWSTNDCLAQILDAEACFAE